MIERKNIGLDAAQLKFDDERKGYFSGYASTFNGVDTYGDTVLPGAYKSTLENRQRPVALRWNHYGPVIGKWIHMEEDQKGLFVEGELTPGHSVAEDAHALMKHGAVTGLSIGYRVKKFEETGEGRRNLKEIDLVEISVVESPADLGAQIANIKSAIDEAESLKDIERLLRDASGFSRADATALVSRIKSLARGEHDAEIKAKDALAALTALTHKLTR